MRREIGWTHTVAELKARLAERGQQHPELKLKVVRHGFSTLSRHGPLQTLGQICASCREPMVRGMEPLPICANCLHLIPPSAA